MQQNQVGQIGLCKTVHMNVGESNEGVIEVQKVKILVENVKWIEKKNKIPVD